MKNLIVSLLVVLTSTIVFAEDQDDAATAAPVNFDLSQVQGSTNADGTPAPRLNLNRTETQFRPLTEDERYEADRINGLRAECQYRRPQDQASHGNGLVDRAIGNKVRDNLEQNRRDAMDGFGSVQRSDGTQYVYRRDRCDEINGNYQTDEQKEAGRPGFKATGSVGRHSVSVGGTLRW